MTRTQHHEDERTRNTRLEGQYSFDRRGERSVLSFVVTYREELAEEYRAWRGAHRGGSEEDAVRRWEAVRFGEALYMSAHGILIRQTRIYGNPVEPGRLPYRDDD